MSVQNYLESAQTCYFLTRNLQNRIFFNFLARIRQSFFLQILYVIIAISVHNSAQNIIKLCFDRAKKSTFRMSDKYEESQSTPAFAVTFKCFWQLFRRAPLGVLLLVWSKCLAWCYYLNPLLGRHWNLVLQLFFLAVYVLFFIW